MIFLAHFLARLPIETGLACYRLTKLKRQEHPYCRMYRQPG
jgi:hypothetical protein